MQGRLREGEYYDMSLFNGMKTLRLYFKTEGTVCFFERDIPRRFFKTGHFSKEAAEIISLEATQFMMMAHYTMVNKNKIYKALTNF